MSGRNVKPSASVFQQYQLHDDFCTKLAHFESEFSSTIALSTIKGELKGLDLRSSKEVWSYKCPPHLGNLTAMCVDKNRNWILLGTHRGVLTLFDVRFQANTASWRHPSCKKINQLERYCIQPQGKPQANISKSIIISVQNKANEISVWDVDTKQCFQVWGTSKDDMNSSQEEIDAVYGDGFTV